MFLRIIFCFAKYDIAQYGVQKLEEFLNMRKYSRCVYVLFFFTGSEAPLHLKNTSCFFVSYRYAI